MDQMHPERVVAAVEQPVRQRFGGVGVAQRAGGNGRCGSMASQRAAAGSAARMASVSETAETRVKPVRKV